MNQFTPHSFPNAPQGFHNRIRQTLADLPERKEVSHMKRKAYTKLLIVAAVLVAVLATAAFASGMFRTPTVQTTAPLFASFPTEQEVLEALGTAPKLVETFSNGYTFNGAYGTTESAADGAQQALLLVYVRDNANITLLLDRRTDLSPAEGDTELPATESHPALYYRSEPVEGGFAQSLSWTDGGLSYTIQAMSDSGLSRTELVSMVQELVSQH